jgi:deoxyribodipyrimidine photo-lyase
MAGLRTIRLAIMLFTRDLRLRDNPALDAAARRAQALVPLFVLDDRLVAAPLAAPNRVRLLLEP